eukprot:7620718-Pyramimonas_sp.AAC.1
MEYRMTRPCLTQEQNEALLCAWFQDPIDQLYEALGTTAPRQLFGWFMDPIWDRVDQCRPRVPRRHVADRLYFLQATLPDHVAWTG